MVYHGKYIMIRQIIKSVGISIYIQFLGHCLTTGPDWDSFFQYTWVSTQLFNIPWLGRCFTTHHGQDAVLQHALVGMQLYDIPWSERSFRTCPVGDTV